MARASRGRGAPDTPATFRRIRSASRAYHTAAEPPQTAGSHLSVRRLGKNRRGSGDHFEFMCAELHPEMHCLSTGYGPARTGPESVRRAALSAQRSHTPRSTNCRVFTSDKRYYVATKTRSRAWAGTGTHSPKVQQIL